jgi:hypothetical protein
MGESKYIVEIITGEGRIVGSIVMYSMAPTDTSFYSPV